MHLFTKSFTSIMIVKGIPDMFVYSKGVEQAHLSLYA